MSFMSPFASLPKRYRQGRAELLELLLFITVDLLCQVLYGAALPQDELNVLVEALSEYTVPATAHRGVYPGGLDCYDYHRKVAKEISDKAPDGVFAKIIMKDEHMSETNRYENCAFFLEALTPVFASFWTLCNVLLKSSHESNIKDVCLQDPVFREKCIKESLRMYPPVPVLWARIANKTHSFDNPLYDATVEDKRGILGRIFSKPDFRTVKSITIKKDTMVFTVPACLHYDDRFWLNPEEFLPSRWDKDPRIIKSNTTTVRLARKTCWGALALSKEEDIEARQEYFCNSCLFSSYPSLSQVFNILVVIKIVSREGLLEREEVCIRQYCSPPQVQTLWIKRRG